MRPPPRRQERDEGVPFFTIPELVAMAQQPGDRRLVYAGMWQTIQRPEQLIEFVDLYWADGRKPMPAQARKAIRELLADSDPAALLACPQGVRCTLRDLIRITHAAPLTQPRAIAFSAILKRK